MGIIRKFGIAIAGVFILAPNAALTKPIISWTDRVLNVRVDADNGAEIGTSFVSKINLQNVVLSPNAGISEYVSVEPDEFDNIVAGQEYDVNIQIGTANAILGKIFEGVIVLRNTGATEILSRPLPIEIEFGDSIELVDGIDYVPPNDWQVAVEKFDAAEETYIQILTPETLLDAANPENGHIPPDIVLEVRPNPNSFSLSQYVDHYEEGWFADYPDQSSSVTGLLDVITVSDLNSPEGRVPYLAAFVELNPEQIMTIIASGDAADLRDEVQNEINYIIETLGR